MKKELSAKHLERKLKKDVWAKSYTIGVFYPKEFIEHGHRELVDLGYGSWKMETYGFEGLGTLHDVYRLNIHSRFASRILIRLATLRAGASEQLFSEILKVPLQYWLPVDWLDPTVPRDRIQMDLRVFLKHSLIHHQGKAEKTLFKAIGKMLYENSYIPDFSRAQLNIEYLSGRYYLHLEGNKGVLSVDTSGSSLQKRGYRIHPGPAPLAEHKAAALVQGLYNHCPEPGWVLDGMSGAGTQLFESILRLLHIAPGSARAFQYQTWMSFRNTTDGYWRRQQGIVDSMSSSIAKPGNSPTFIAIDQSSDSLEALKTNLRQFQRIYNLSLNLDMDSDDDHVPGASPLSLNIWQKNLFDVCRSDIPVKKPGWIMINPPYDIRIEANLELMVSSILEWLGQWQGCFVSILLPKGSQESRFDSIPQLRRPIYFDHGGREIVQLLLRIP
jgi:putative N6-adenine-specific DNA methylase